jgi:hypothetical protein
LLYWFFPPTIILIFKQKLQLEREWYWKLFLWPNTNPYNWRGTKTVGALGLRLLISQSKKGIQQILTKWKQKVLRNTVTNKGKTGLSRISESLSANYFYFGWRVLAIRLNPGQLVNKLARVSIKKKWIFSCCNKQNKYLIQCPIVVNHFPLWCCLIIQLSTQFIVWIRCGKIRPDREICLIRPDLNPTRRDFFRKSNRSEPDPKPEVTRNQTTQNPTRSEP